MWNVCSLSYKPGVKWSIHQILHPFHNVILVSLPIWMCTASVCFWLVACCGPGMCLSGVFVLVPCLCLWVFYSIFLWGDNNITLSCLCLLVSPSGKKFRSKPQLARYLGNQMDLSSFDFRTGKMLMSKLNKNRQRLRYDNNNQNKVRQTCCWPPCTTNMYR